MYRDLAVVLLILLSSVSTFAIGTGETNLLFDAAAGIPSGKIINPDGSKATYTGLSSQGRVVFPFFGSDGFSSSVTTTIRYLDYKNTANGSSQKEIANHLGVGGGLRLAYKRIYIGAEYYYMKARHYTIGNISRETTFDYSPLSYYVGLGIPFGSIQLGVSYSISSATIPNSQTGLSKSSPYTDSIILFHITIDSGKSTSDFFGWLFK